MDDPLARHILKDHGDHPEAKGMTENLDGYFRTSRSRWHGSRFPDCKVHWGQSIHELIWLSLDATVDELIEQRGSNQPGWSERIPALRGKALGLATALAIVINPYAPDVDAVRAEAMERLDAR